MRRMCAVLFLGAILACRGNSNGPSKQSSALELRLVRFGKPVQVTGTGFYLAPRFSPDGRHLLFSGVKYRGLYVSAVGHLQPVKELTDEEFVGWAARWTAKGIETRTRDGRVVLFKDPLGKARRVETGQRFDPRAPFGPLHVYHEHDAIHLLREGKDVVISDGADRYFAPVPSPDRRYVVYEGLVSGLRVYEIETGRTVLVGRGNNPAWLQDSSGFLFDVTEDDGLNLTAGEIYAYFVDRGQRVRLTNTPDLIETHPMPSPDGTLVAFESDGRVYVAPIVWSSGRN